MRLNTALVLAAATAASAEYDTFEACQAACEAADDCHSAAYSAGSQECNLYPCGISESVEAPEGIQLHRKSGSPDVTTCPEAIFYPTTETAAEAAADPDSASDDTPVEDVCVAETVTVTVTETMPCDYAAAGEETGGASAYPPRGGNSTHVAGSAGGCVPGTPGCNEGYANYTTSDNSSSPQAGAPGSSETLVRVNGAGKLVSGLLPVVGLVIAMLCY